MNLSIEAAFNRHLGRMTDNMQSMMGAGSGTGSGSGANSSSRGVNLYTSFRAAVNETLWISALAAFVIAGVAALIISRRITRPIHRLTSASQQIAAGEYSHRIPADEITQDELGQLGHSFNQMAEKLENTEALRRQLLGDISHELRTPLTAIKGSMEGLMDGVLPAEQSTYQQIYREADRLQRLVEDLQELNRVDGQTYPLEKRLVQAADLLKAALTPAGKHLRHERRQSWKAISKPTCPASWWIATVFNRCCITCWATPCNSRRPMDKYRWRL